MLTDVVIANKSYTKLNIADKEKADQIALKVIKQDCPGFLLPIRTMEVDDELEIRYELQDGVRLSYSSMEMSRRDFAGLLKNMLEPFQSCSDWFLDYHNLLLDPEHMLIGRNGMSVKYLYLPAEEYAQSDKRIGEFFYDFIVQADVTDDPRYTTNLLRILKRDGSNLMTLLEYLTKDVPTDAVTPAMAGNPERSAGTPAGGQTVPPAAAPPVFREPVQSAPVPVKETASREQSLVNAAESAGFRKTAPASRPGQAVEFGKQDVEGNLMGSLFGEEEEAEEKGKRRKGHGEKPQKGAEKPQKSGGFLGMFKGGQKGAGQPEKENQHPAAPVSVPGPAAPAAEYYAGTGMRQSSAPAYFEDDRTEISADEPGFNPNSLRLSLESNAGRDDCPPYLEIDLARGFATVGRTDKSGHNQSDYNFPPSFTFISRRHFRVERNETELKIIDLGSANGTFVNGQALVPNIPYPLHSGDTIMISQQHRLIYRVC